LYAEGLDRLRVFDARGARPALEKASVLDPRNATVHSALGAMWSSLGYSRQAAAEAKHAFDLSAASTREDRLAIEARYRETTQEWAKAAEIYRTLFTFFPDNVDYGLRLADALDSAGKPKDALATIAVLRALPPPASEDPRIDLSESAAAESLSDLKLQLAAAERAIAKGSALGARLLVARARNLEGLVYRNTGDDSKARTAFDAAMQLFESAGDRNGAARILNNQALVVMQKGDLPGARKLFEAAHAGFNEIGNLSGVALALGNIGNIEYMQGHVAAAQKMWTETLATYRQVDNKEGVARMLANIGSALADQGDAAGAKRSFEASLAEYRAIGDKTGVTTGLQNLAELLFQKGDLAGSRERYEEVLPLWREIGNRGQVAETLVNLGAILRAQDAIAQARAKYDEAVALQQAINAGGDIARTRLALAVLSIDEGRAIDAEQPARDAADEFRKEKVGDQEASAYNILARSLFEQHKLGDARTAIEHAVTLSQKIDNRRIRLAIAITEGRIAAASNRTAESERTLGTALKDAQRFAFAEYELEARLALGEVEQRAGRATADAHLAALAREATAKGHLLIARKADAARTRGAK